MIYIRLILLALLIVSIPAQARMYQWLDPDSGTTQLSGKPPVWYRSAETGPRVIVFEKGRVIDDTNIALPDQEREALRMQALLRAEEDREQARQKAEEAAKLKAALDQEQAQEAESVTPSTAETEEAPAQPGEPDEQSTAGMPQSEDTTADKMKALVADWEKLMTEQAKQKLGTDEGPAANREQTSP